MIVGELHPSERAMDEAMARLASLTTAMIAARATAGVSAVVGQEAFDRVGEAMALLFQARSRLLDAHQRLNEARIEVGLGAVAFGPPDECPEPKKVLTGVGNLRVAA